jgi:ubiquinone/menaquinone biosynthesis C-methylase UbiE
MVNRANERAQRESVAGLVEFWAGDAQALPLDDDQFDIVLSEFVTGLVPDKEMAISEYCRVAKRGGTIGLNEGTWIKPSPPAGLVEFMRVQVGFQGEVLSPESWQDLLTAAGVRELVIETHKVETLRSPRDDIADLIRSWPRLIKMVVHNPRFRKFLRISLSIPEEFLQYIGYGLYVGVNGFPGKKEGAHDGERITAA